MLASTSWEEQLEEAVSLTLTADFTEAEALFSKLLHTSGRDEQVLFEYGNLCAQQGAFDEAVESYRETLSKNPLHIECLINLGNTLAYNDKGREGAHLLQKALKLAPGNSDIHFSLGNIYYGNGSPTRAIEHFRKAVIINPQNINAQCNLGCILAEENHLEEAISAFDAVLREWPDDYEILINLGNIYYDLKQFSKSKDFYLRASSIKRCTDSLNNVGSCYLAMKQIDEALTTFNESLVLAENNPCALNNIGHIYLKKNDYPLAIRHFKQALEYSPEYYEALINLGNAYNKCKEEEKAKDSYLEALTYNSQSAVAHYNLGNIYHQQNDFDQAELHYKTAIKMAPDYVDAYCNLGGIYIIKHRAPEAAELYKRALVLEPENQSLWYNLGNSYTMSKNDDQAIEAYEKVLQLNPDHKAAEHVLATLRGEITDSAPDDYVKGLFDEYSYRFEEHLTTVLEYKTPRLLKILNDNISEEEKRYTLMADLGCGTGLAGAEFAPECNEIIGVDLSPKMLDQARRKRIYSNLYAAPIDTWLEETDQTFDLVVAADVFVYIGKLDNLFKALALKVVKGTRFLFSVESYDGDKFTLRQSGRFAHSDEYIKELSVSVGARILKSESCNLRKENDEWIEGTLYALEF